jgi:hypothetical protein
MKRFLIGLLAVGLVMALSMPAPAATSFTAKGFYEVGGYWESNRAFKSSDEIAQKYYTSRFQINPVFKVAEGLQLVTRFEGLERMVGRDAVGYAITGSNARNSAAEQDITMRRAYIDFRALSGQFLIGYMAGGRFGTEFVDYENEVFRVRYNGFFGPLTVILLTEKATENTLGTPNTSDSDNTKYAAAGIYKWSGGEAGALVQWYKYDYTEQTATAARRSFYLGVPYFKANFGPVYAEGEIDYVWGKCWQYLNSATPDVDFKSFNWYLKAKYTMGPAFIGGQIAVIQGDDPTTTDKVEAAPFAPINGYVIYQPTLVLWNDWTSRMTGANYGTNGTVGSTGLPSNANIYQIFAGFKPMAKLDLYAAYSFLKVNEKPTGYIDDSYGKEFDITATYKIFDNLAYQAAFGYLWTGDYFKGTATTNTVGNDWLLMHKLTLTF